MFSNTGLNYLQAFLKCKYGAPFLFIQNFWGWGSSKWISQKWSWGAFLLKNTDLEGNQLARRELMQNTAITIWPLDRVWDSTRPLKKAKISGTREVRISNEKVIHTPQHTIKWSALRWSWELEKQKCNDEKWKHFKCLFEIISHFRLLDSVSYP